MHKYGIYPVLHGSPGAICVVAGAPVFPRGPLLQEIFEEMLRRRVQPDTWRCPTTHSMEVLPIYTMAMLVKTRGYYFQWEFQDLKMEVLYYIRPYFVGIFPYIGLIYGRYLQFRILEWHAQWLIYGRNQNPCLLGAQQGERSRQRQVHGVQTGPMGSKFQRASGL